MLRRYITGAFHEPSCVPDEMDCDFSNDLVVSGSLSKYEQDQVAAILSIREGDFEDVVATAGGAPSNIGYDLMPAGYR